jgi:hypothetical protein
MALAYDATRVTRDVGSLFVPHGIVLAEARNVAQQLGLPMWWLNEQASTSRERTILANGACSTTPDCGSLRHHHGTSSR